MPLDQNVQDRIGFLISLIARMKRTRFDNCAREVGLTRPQWRALNGIRAREGINQTRLAELLEVGHITVTRQLNALEAMGWVTRLPDPADRRSWLLYLTPAAEPILRRIDTLVEALHDEEYAGLSARELETLEKSLKKIHGNLKISLKDSPLSILPSEVDSVE